MTGSDVIFRAARWRVAVGAIVYSLVSVGCVLLSHQSDLKPVNLFSSDILTLLLPEVRALFFLLLALLSTVVSLILVMFLVDDRAVIVSDEGIATRFYFGWKEWAWRDFDGFEQYRVRGQDIDTLRFRRAAGVWGGRPLRRVNLLPELLFGINHQEILWTAKQRIAASTTANDPAPLPGMLKL